MSDARNKDASARWLPWAVSIAAHLVLIIAGFFVVFGVTRRAPDPPPVTISFDDPGMARAPAEAPIEQREAPVEFPELEDFQPIEEPDAPSLDELLAEPSIQQPVVRTTRSPESMSELLRDAAVPEVRFAGLGASNAEQVVYVLDASGSMVAALPLVMNELEQSLRRLDPTQRFQVVVYQGGSYLSAPHPEDGAQAVPTTRLIRARAEYVDAVIRWMRSTVSPKGVGDPMPGLEVALALRPDAVFWLAYRLPGVGEFKQSKETMLARLDALNPSNPRSGRRAITIKTIQFIDPDPTGIVEAVGRLHGGAGASGSNAGDSGYRFYSREDLGL